MATLANVRVIQSPNGGLQQSVATVTLRNTVQTAVIARLDALQDVVPDSANTEAGSTLVYDPTTDKYIVKLLDLDGGNF